MNSTTARLLMLLAVFLGGAGCSQTPAGPAATAPGELGKTGPLEPSPNPVVGRLLAVDPSQSFAFVEVFNDAPAAALTEGAELIVRTMDLRETARLRTSRYFRGKTLGTNIISGQPSPGQEVVYPRR